LLAQLQASVIHRPWSAALLERADAGVELGNTYPEPIIDPSRGRGRALKAYARVHSACLSQQRQLYTSANPAIVAASITLGDAMDDDKPILEQMTDAVSTAAAATTDAAKTVVKKVRKAARKVTKKVTPKKAKKAKKAPKKSSAKKSAKKSPKKSKKATKKVARKKKKAKKSKR
jgi:deoxyribodipyrimidine photolyase